MRKAGFFGGERSCSPQPIEVFDPESILLPAEMNGVRAF